MAYTLAESGIASLVIRCNNIINGEYGDDTQKEIDDLMEEMKGFELYLKMTRASTIVNSRTLDGVKRLKGWLTANAASLTMVKDSTSITNNNQSSSEANASVAIRQTIQVVRTSQLTDDEKDAMSDSEVEKYEQKIKDALLRRDSNLSTVSSALKEIMAGSVEVNGKNMYLSDFGIETLSYFTAAENEKNAYHINGDADDSSTSGNADKLKSMISSDPDTVVSFFSGLFKNLYTKMSDLSKSVEGYRSYGNFYDDKKMKSDYDDYKTKISELEKKLNDYEDKWYSKFSKMETALAKLQSNSSAVTGLLGGS